MSALRRALTAACACALAAAARAHDGPPYPVLVDAELSGREVSVWADPDVGVGTFFLYVEPAEGAAEALLPLELRATPEDGAHPESRAAAAAADEGAPYQLVCELPYAARGWWTTRLVRSDTGEELTIDVEVTPPGSFGPVDLLWFLFPFLAVGFLWMQGMRRQRAYDRAQREAAA